MQDLAVQLLSRFMSIREKHGESIDIGDAAMIISDLMDIIEKHTIGTEKDIYGEIKDISTKIKQVKEEIVENLPNGTVPEATKELDEVVKSTEDATNSILDSADRIRDFISKLPNYDDCKPIEDETIKIFEACNFQDLTGQRIKKVTSTLQYIEDALANILATFENRNNEKRVLDPKKLSELKGKSLMNGPQLEAIAPSQSDIDKLFDSL